MASLSLSLLFSFTPSRPLPTHRLNATHKVTLHTSSTTTTTLDVSDSETILEKAVEAGLDVPHDCKLGVCMTCPARLVSGQVDQSEGMLSDDVVDRGFALLCVAYPRSDCEVRVVDEEELLEIQLATAND